MTFKNPYWSRATKIELLERWVLVHSIIYYEFDSSVVTDYMFDSNAKQLAKALKKYPEDAACTKYAYCFTNFDGSTGHHLYWSLSKQDKASLVNIATMVLAMVENERKGRKQQ